MEPLKPNGEMMPSYDVDVQIDDIHWSADCPLPPYLVGEDQKDILAEEGKKKIHGWEYFNLTITGRKQKRGKLHIEQTVPREYIEAGAFMEENIDMLEDIREDMEAAMECNVDLDYTDATVFVDGKRRSLSSSYSNMKDQLIKLGEKNPELRKNLRPVLDTISEQQDKKAAGQDFSDHSRMLRAFHEEIQSSIKSTNSEDTEKAYDTALKKFHEAAQEAKKQYKKNEGRPVGDNLSKFYMAMKALAYGVSNF